MALEDSAAPIDSLKVSAYRIPTDGVESDGTLEWDSTTLVLVQLSAGGREGLGFTYADSAAARLIQERFTGLLPGENGLATNACREKMLTAIRNLGRPGICSMAISAVDTALWDVKAKLLDVPLVTLLGAKRESVLMYGSGGFTSYNNARLRDQLAGWAGEGMTCVKMKVGRAPGQDPERVRSARMAIGGDAQLFVDANGAYSRKQALAMAAVFAEFDVRWFEEPVSSDDLAGLRLLRDRGPGNMAISAGEYGYDLGYFRRMLAAQAVDVLQADATRCGGITGFLGTAALCEAFQIPLSCHCAPYLHLHAACAASPVLHAEYFYDHARIEHALFEGATRPKAGRLYPDLSRPGLGLEFKWREAEKYAIG